MTETFETVEAWQLTDGNAISYKIHGAARHLDKIEKGTVTKVIPSEDGYDKPMIVSVRLENGFTRHHEFHVTKPVRRYI
jgi:hypothetical protein